MQREQGTINKYEFAYLTAVFIFLLERSPKINNFIGYSGQKIKKAGVRLYENDEESDHDARLNPTTNPNAQVLQR